MSEADGITTTVSVGKQGQSPRTIHDARCLEARQRLLVGGNDRWLPAAPLSMSRRSSSWRGRFPRRSALERRRRPERSSRRCYKWRVDSQSARSQLVQGKVSKGASESQGARNGRCSPWRAERGGSG